MDFERESRSFVLFTYLGLTLDEGQYQGLIWHNCRINLELMYGYSFASGSVHVYVNVCQLFDAFMKLQSILAIFNAILFLLCTVS